MDRNEAVRKNTEGLKLIEKGQYEEAIRLFNEAIEMDPSYSAAWFNRSDAYRKLGREAQADADKEEADRLMRADADMAQQRRIEEAEILRQTAAKRAEQRGSIKGEGPLIASDIPAGREPWGWGTLLTVSLFGGWPAAGIIAGINWRRMGRPNLMWLTIVISVVAFIVLMFVPMTGNDSMNETLGRVICVAVAGGLWLWQRSYHRVHSAGKRAGWQIPLLTIIAVNAIVLGIIFTGGVATGPAVSHFNQGVELQEQRRFEEAKEKYTEAIELDPEFTEAYYNRAIIYGQVGELDKAIADCNQAIKLDPKLAEAYLIRGACYADKGEIVKAVSDLKKVINLSDDQELVTTAQMMLITLEQ